MEVAVPEQDAQSAPTIVAVPKTLRNAHRVAQYVLDHPDEVGLRKTVAHRAALIVQGLAVAMEDRGWTIELNSKRRPFAFVNWSGHEINFSIEELSTRTPHVPTKTELAKQERHRWHVIPD